ncbi:phage tail protein [Klebsiella pneumoniae]|nr:phage tail protein [Klebsiella pneumoniae]SAW44441.1 Uncharacterised protein [Klebsiella pneumoniae]
MYHLDNASSVPDMPAIKPVLFTERRWFTEGGDGIQPRALLNKSNFC